MQVRLTFKPELQQLWVGSAVYTQASLPPGRCEVRAHHLLACAVPDRALFIHEWCIRTSAKLMCDALPTCLLQKVMYATITKIESQPIKGQEEYSSEPGGGV